MNKLRLFPIALTALVLGACSSEDVIDNGGQPQWNSQGKGYINLAIQLPTQPSTRANDVFDDGTPAEYDVKDATLILFVKDNTSGDFKVNSAYDMNLSFSLDGNADDNITTTAKITQEINSVSGDIKALVVLNRNGAFTVDNGVLTVGGNPATDKNLSQLNDAVKDAIGISYSWHGNGLLMSNAIMSDTPGNGTTEPTNAKIVGPLVDIANDKIHKTKAEADADPAATIYVERAEAKVTVQKDASISNTGKVTDGSDFTYTIDGWALDNTNKTNKLVRDATDFNTWKTYASTKTTTNYRFIGSNQIADNLYRIYWGDDYNYTGMSSDDTGLNTIGGANAVIDDDGLIAADGKSPAYCFENTTDLADMLEKNLTRVIVRATFNGGEPFYTVDGNRKVIWKADEDNLKKLKEEVAARLLNDVTFNEWAKKHVAQGKTLSSETDFDVDFSKEAAGKRTVTSITLNDSGKEKLTDSSNSSYPADAATLANNHITLEYYANGDAYYPVYIRHFDDSQTPWSVNDQEGNVIYGNNPGNYLGRYGVLRNNWYDITVRSIKSLGDPNVTVVTSDPVDKKESYISVDINVLSWAKRTQSVDL